MESNYKSPIDVLIEDINTLSNSIEKQVREGYDQMVYEAVVNCGVTVDKEELIKALQYDRAQYDKGYADAMTQIKNIIEECKEGLFDEVCKDLHDYTFEIKHKGGMSIYL